METVKEQLAFVVRERLNEQGFELVDFSIGRGKNGSTVRLFVDKEGGITVGDCAFLSGMVSGMLEQEHLFEGPYRLEVSSPGLDRPLKTTKDFQRQLGKTLAVEYTEAGARKCATGDLVHASEDGIVLETDAGSLVLPLASLERAKIKLKW